MQKCPTLWEIYLSEQINFSCKVLYSFFHIFTNEISIALKTQFYRQLLHYSAILLHPIKL